jgi:radical SAM superfamily enzyme YgiQ (UPF0313 family)
MEKITVIIPQYKPKGSYYELPIGLAYIIASLKEHGHEIECINLNNTELAAAVISGDYVLTGGLSIHYHQIKNIIQCVRFEKPSAKIIVGGGLISSCPELMEHLLDFDLGVIGEGENVIIGAEGLQYSYVINDLDSLPFPAYDAIGINEYLDRQICGDEYYLYPVDKPRALPIISSRSCPYNCTFCFHPLGNKYRVRPLDDFFSEVEHLIINYNINILTILDELLAADLNRLESLCSGLRKFNIKWMCQMRVDVVTRGILELMAESGCFLISYGIEHISQPVLDSFKKHTTRAQIENALALTRNAKIGIQGNILLGDKAETVETFQEAINWLNENKKYMINTVPVIPYPGTELFNKIFISEKDKIEYIARECPSVKMCVCDTYIPLPELIPCKPLNCIKTGWDDQRGHIWQITVTCPHCSNLNVYPGLFWGGTGIGFTHGRAYRIGCRHCNQRFDIERWC